MIEVAFQDNVIAKEELPLPIVYYPGFYGTFFGFSEVENSEIYLCSCTFIAIENYIEFKVDKKRNNADEHRNNIIDSSDFPYKLSDKYIKNTLIDIKSLMDSFQFKQKICHECNKSIPTFSYCHPMYGGKFKQSFGWYIN